MVSLLFSLCNYLKELPCLNEVILSYLIFRIKRLRPINFKFHLIRATLGGSIKGKNVFNNLNNNNNNTFIYIALFLFLTNSALQDIYN